MGSSVSSLSFEISPEGCTHGCTRGAKKVIEARDLLVIRRTDQILRLSFPAIDQYIDT